jgi:hypothetical protein
VRGAEHCGDLVDEAALLEELQRKKGLVRRHAGASSVDQNLGDGIRRKVAEQAVEGPGSFLEVRCHGHRLFAHEHHQNLRPSRIIHPCQS